MIPTAEEFLESTGAVYFTEIKQKEAALIQFAKLHVEAALKAVWDKSEEWYNGVDIPIRVIDNDSELIVNIYPLENIK
jgi:hypothetical protein